MPFTKPISAPEIAEIVHELRSPLGGIEAMATLLAQSPLNSEQMRLVEALKASAAHLRQVAGRVLSPEAMKRDEAARPLRAVLAEIVPSFEARALAAGLSFRLVVAEDGLNFCEIEAGGFRQVLENLADNAIRLSLSGGITLTIARSEAGRLLVSMQDDGPGLSKDMAEALIRDGGAVPGREGGAGIGLTICGRLVAQQGGQLRGGPGDDGRGACFRFDWPIAHEHAGQGQAECLVVDDHPASRLVLKTILGAFGVSCDEASGVSEALALLAQRQYAVLFTDLRMPGEGGTRLIEAVLAKSVGERPRIVVASADEMDESDPLAAYIDAAILKPLAIPAIAEVVARLRLGKSRDKVA